MYALVIDDSLVVRSVLRSILMELGYRVMEAANGREGVECLQEHGMPALILVDWNMPEMNGLDFIRTLRADHDYDDIVVVMVATETEKQRICSALDAGANEYLMKPFTKQMIIEKLALLGIAGASSPQSLSAGFGGEEEGAKRAKSA